MRHGQTSESNGRTVGRLRGDRFERIVGGSRWRKLSVLAAGAIVVGAALILLSPSEGVAKPNFLADFNDAYGTATTRIDACMVCHVSSSNSNRNSYGRDWKNAGKNFTAIENVDSDGDGWTNLEEIAALTFPGDPADHPVAAECNGLVATIVGTPGDDVLRGTSGDDVIAGLGGNDKIYGKGGNDTLCGGAGNDKIYPGKGVDFVHGGGGTRDWVSYVAAKGGVTVSLRKGVAVGQGKDTLKGIENIVGSAFADKLTGNSRANRIIAGAGPDAVAGKSGDDVMWGKAGRDILNGGSGSDVAKGGSGNDTCTAEVTSSC